MAKLAELRKAYEEAKHGQQPALASAPKNPMAPALWPIIVLSDSDDSDDNTPTRKARPVAVPSKNSKPVLAESRKQATPRSAGNFIVDAASSLFDTLDELNGNTMELGEQPQDVAPRARPRESDSSSGFAPMELQNDASMVATPRTSEVRGKDLQAAVRFQETDLGTEQVLLWPLAAADAVSSTTGRVVARGADLALKPMDVFVNRPAALQQPNILVPKRRAALQKVEDAPTFDDDRNKFAAQLRTPQPVIPAALPVRVDPRLTFEQETAIAMQPTAMSAITPRTKGPSASLKRKFAAASLLVRKMKQSKTKSKSQATAEAQEANGDGSDGSDGSDDSDGSDGSDGSDDKGADAASEDDNNNMTELQAMAAEREEAEGLLAYQEATEGGTATGFAAALRVANKDSKNSGRLPSEKAEPSQFALALDGVLQGFSAPELPNKSAGDGNIDAGGWRTWIAAQSNNLYAVLSDSALASADEEPIDAGWRVELLPVPDAASLPQIQLERIGNDSDRKESFDMVSLMATSEPMSDDDWSQLSVAFERYEQYRSRIADFARYAGKMAQDLATLQAAFATFVGRKWDTSIVSDIQVLVSTISSSGIQDAVAEFDRRAHKFAEILSSVYNARGSAIESYAVVRRRLEQHESWVIANQDLLAQNNMNYQKDHGYRASYRMRKWLEKDTQIGLLVQAYQWYVHYFALGTIAFTLARASQKRGLVPHPKSKLAVKEFKSKDGETAAAMAMINVAAPLMFDYIRGVLEHKLTMNKGVLNKQGVVSTPGSESQVEKTAFEVVQATRASLAGSRAKIMGGIKRAANRLLKQLAKDSVLRNTHLYRQFRAATEAFDKEKQRATERLSESDASSDGSDREFIDRDDDGEDNEVQSKEARVIRNVMKVLREQKEQRMMPGTKYDETDPIRVKYAYDLWSAKVAEVVKVAKDRLKVPRKTVADAKANVKAETHKRDLAMEQGDNVAAMAAENDLQYYTDQLEIAGAELRVGMLIVELEVAEAVARTRPVLIADGVPARKGEKIVTDDDFVRQELRILDAKMDLVEAMQRNDISYLMRLQRQELDAETQDAIAEAQETLAMDESDLEEAAKQRNAAYKAARVSVETRVPDVNFGYDWQEFVTNTGATKPKSGRVGDKKAAQANDDAATFYGKKGAVRRKGDASAQESGKRTRDKDADSEGDDDRRETKRQRTAARIGAAIRAIALHASLSCALGLHRVHQAVARADAGK